MKATILNASAGSGKTYQLAYNYVRDVIAQPTIYRHILAVTFTNKATEEMKSRILKEIHRLASDYKSPYRKDLCRELSMSPEEVRRRAIEARTYILHDYSRFTVLTIDTFFQRVLRAFLKELDIDLNYNIELETNSLLTQSTDSLIEQIATDRKLLKWMTGFVEERIEAGKSWDIREGIRELGDEIFKERNKNTINERRSREELEQLLAEMKQQCEAKEKKICDLATQMKALCDERGLTVSDFPNGKNGFGQWFLSIAEHKKPRAYGDRVRTACTDDSNWSKKSPMVAALRPQLQPMLQAMCEIYDSSIRHATTYNLLRETYRSFALLGDLNEKVEQLCVEQQVMLLSETKYRLSKFITEQDAPFIYEKVGTRFEHFMIDEFQDTSVKEWENFLPLLKNALAQSEKLAVLLVGDIKQSIYRWRGGDWKILHTEAEQALGKEQTLVKPLEDNYRSLPEIVNFNNLVFERLIKIDNSVLNAELNNAVLEGRLESAAGKALLNTLEKAYSNAAQIPRRRNDHEGYISISNFESEPPVIERICKLIDLGYRPSDIMILVRTKNEAAAIATTLMDFKSRNEEPRYRFDVMTQEALIIGTANVSRFVAALFSLALNSDDMISRAIYNQYLGHPFDRPLTKSECDFLNSIRILSPEEAFERIVIQYALYERKRETAYIQALHEQILSFSANRIADIALFLNWWNEQGSTRSLSVEESQTTIEISTIHKAKGLEKRVIIIPKCDWSLIPTSRGKKTTIIWSQAAEGEAASMGSVPIRYKKEIADSHFSADYYKELVYSHVDNINLLYVALTRAKESLHIFIPQKGEKHIGALLRDALGIDPSQAEYTIGKFEGPAPQDLRTEEDSEERMRQQEPQIEQQHIILEEYPTSPTEMQLSLPSERYFERSETSELSPRNFGILMHKAFEEAHNREDIARVIERMVLDGILAPTDKSELQRMVDEALSNAEVGSWFDGSWEEVRCEEEIICPAGRGIRRPDRVMIRGKQAVVVDYKFGELDAASYRAQIKRYCQLLGEMGYTELAGYLWYVKLGKIEKVI